MTEFDPHAHWQEVYTTRPATGVSWYQETPEPSLLLLALAGATAADGVVDIGGGASPLAGFLLNRGYRDVSVLDISEAALGRAREALGAAGDRIDWIAADATRWEPARHYDVWHDRAAFHFLVGEEDRRAYLERLRRALRRGGHAIIGTFAPDGPEKCSGLPVRRYDAETLSDTLGPEFRLIDSRRHDHVTPWGAVQRFHFGTFRREA